MPWLQAHINKTASTIFVELIITLRQQWLLNRQHWRMTHWATGVWQLRDGVSWSRLIRTSPIWRLDWARERRERTTRTPLYVCALHGKPHENNAHTNPVTYEVKLLANVVARHAHTLFVICCTSHFLSPIHPPKNHSKKRRSLCLYVVATKRFVPRQKINRRPRETGMITNSTFDGRVL